jgi:putative chitinase
MNITLELLTKLLPATKSDKLQAYVEPLKLISEKYQINTVERLAAFLAQLAHESGGFNFVQENLNYSSQGLQTTFKKYFPTLQSTASYARNPQKIASKVYANRMGNGNEQSGDGWKYRGRGLIQLTGKDNYARFATSINKTLDETVEYLSTIQGAVESAAWFWSTNKLNEIADKNDFVTLTKRINGGTIGLAHRTELFESAKKLLK